MDLLVATPADLPAIMQLLANCIANMQNKGINQWGDFYPTEEIIRRDIKNETLYLLEMESQLAGTVTIDEQQDAQWSQIQWLTDDDKPLAVHRLMIDPAFQGQGYGRAIMEWVENQAASQGYTSIRLDAYQGNPAALSLYENHEFIKTGEVFFPYRTQPFNCYEKILNDNTPMALEDQWQVIYQAMDSCLDIIKVLQDQGFETEIFCDPQCREIYVPGLQNDGYRIRRLRFVAIHKEQYDDALPALQQWHEENRKEHFRFRMSTFSKAMKSIALTLLIIGVISIACPYLPFEVDFTNNITTMIVCGVILWTILFCIQISRKGPSD